VQKTESRFGFGLKEGQTTQNFDMRSDGVPTQMHAIRDSN